MLVLSALLLSCADDPALTDAPPLDRVFDSAAAEYDVPRDLLVSIGWSLSRLDDRGGMESEDGGVGIMNLRSGDRTPSLDEAADALGVDPDDLVLSSVANVKGAAAVLARLADDRSRTTGDAVDSMEEWYEVTADYAGATSDVVAYGFADQVFEQMEAGLLVQVDGSWIEVVPRSFTWREPERRQLSGSSRADQFVAASTANYTSSSRGYGDIDTVVIHTTEGSYSGAVSWFQNSAASASAHYVVRSSDGDITQMVAEEDIAWHAGDWETNKHSIGIEHEGYVSAPETWYTDAMYRSSAALVADICDRYGIPKDRDHVIAHYEVPGCSSSFGGGASCHTDPGTGWDWDYFMSLVGGSTTSPSPSALADGDRTGLILVSGDASAPHQSDTCTVRLAGNVTNGNLYATGTCAPDGHPDVEPVTVTIAGSVMGSTISGTVKVDDYSDSWAGVVNGDGSVLAEWSGSHDVGGSVGTLSYDATLRLDP